jgi:hypothetical protein
MDFLLLICPALVVRSKYPGVEGLCLRVAEEHGNREFVDDFKRLQESGLH